MVARTTPAGNQVANTTAPVAFGNGVAGGWIGYLPRTSDQTGITTQVDVAGVTVTVTVNNSRRLKITGWSNMAATTTDTIAQLLVMEGATVLAYGRGTTAFAGLSYNPPVCVVAVVTPTAGSHTYKLAAARVTGPGTVTVSCSTDQPTFLLVEDMGPA